VHQKVFNNLKALNFVRAASDVAEERRSGNLLDRIFEKEVSERVTNSALTSVWISFIFSIALNTLAFVAEVLKSYYP